jgi:HlyD family secretion protein
VAEAQLAQAQASVDATEARLEQATLRAPFPGTVAALKVSLGETVAPNQGVVSLADLSQFRVQTTDLSERDIGRVQVDQPATVYVEGLDREIEGCVAGIAPGAETIGGDVVYTVYIRLLDHPSELRWGMSVEVQINTSQEGTPTQRHGGKEWRGTGT